MNKYKYIIIGGGMTGDSAVKGIREIDKDGSIALFTKEHHMPYNRPPLTKDLWKGTEVGKIFRGTNNQNADIHINTEINSINPDSKVIKDDKGNEFKYKKLLIATGGKIIKLPFAEEHILYYRTLSDYERLSSLAKTRNRFIVIGGGFIGTEIAAALAMNSKQVTIVFPEKLLGERVFPKDLAEYVTDFYKGKGVTVNSEESALSIEKSGDEYVLTTSSGKEIRADLVVGGIGIKPETSLAESAGIEVVNGILVNEFLKTNKEDIYAAGDAANFYNPHLSKRIRIEHADNADRMGKQAGLNMAGKEEPYNYLPFFYSDMFELGYEAIGELNSAYETFSDWTDPFRKGVIYYLKDGKVRGVLLWNVWGRVNEARELIGSNQLYKPDELRGKIKE